MKNYIVPLPITSQSCMDIIFLRELYHKISDVVGEEPMERLNQLTQQRFLIAAPLFCFAQGMTNDLLYSLRWRDIETNKNGSSTDFRHYRQ